MSKLQDHDVWVLDNLSNGNLGNLKGLNHHFVLGDIRNQHIFRQGFDLIIHLAAQINVQESIDHPDLAYEVNTLGTFRILEFAREWNTRVLLMSTCMVYEMSSWPITDGGVTKPTSPYAGSKLAAEDLAMSYHYGLGLPVTILRPFNVYGPYQKTNGEGGVVSIFIKRHLEGKALLIYGDGTQTRDLMYVEDCADFIVQAALSEKTVGMTLNAGTGRSVSINELAEIISGEVLHVPHHHPQAEIQSLRCDASMARETLNWSPNVTLEEGIKLTTDWIRG